MPTCDPDHILTSNNQEIALTTLVEMLYTY